MKMPSDLIGVKALEIQSGNDSDLPSRLGSAGVGVPSGSEEARPPLDPTARRSDQLIRMDPDRSRRLPMNVGGARYTLNRNHARRALCERHDQIERAMSWNRIEAEDRIRKAYEKNQRLGGWRL